MNTLGEVGAQGQKAPAIDDNSKLAEASGLSLTVAHSPGAASMTGPSRMRRLPFSFRRPLGLIAGLSAIVLQTGALDAITTALFDSSQAIALTNAGTTSDAYRTAGYLFMVTRDKLFTGGTGQILGRRINNPWPGGMEAQAVTEGPVHSKAKMTIERADGELFAIPAFTVKILANTSGAGAALEIMPLLNGEDGLPDPVMFNVTGHSNQSFSFTPTQLTGFDSYQVTLYVDFAFTSLTLVDASPSSPPPPPQPNFVHLGGTTYQLSWPVGGYSYWFDSSTDLSATGWVQGSEAVNVAGGMNVVNLQQTESRVFYRLSN